MAEPITWRNVVAQENGASLDRMARALNQVTSAFSNLARIPEQLAQQEKDRATDAVSAALSNARSVEDIDSIIRSSQGDWRIDQSDLAAAGNARRAGLRADEVAGFQLSQARDAEAARALQGEIGAQLQQDIIDGKVKSLDQIPGFTTAPAGVKSILQATYGPMIQRADEVGDAAAFRELERQDQLRQNAAQLALQREGLAIQRNAASREQARWDRQDQQAQAAYVAGVLGQISQGLTSVPGVDPAQSSALRGKSWDDLAKFVSGESGNGQELSKLYKQHTLDAGKQGKSPLSPEQFAVLSAGAPAGWLRPGAFNNSGVLDLADAAALPKSDERSEVLRNINSTLQRYGSGQMKHEDFLKQFNVLTGDVKNYVDSEETKRLRQVEVDAQRKADGKAANALYTPVMPRL